MSGWQYGEHIIAIYNYEQSFDVRWDFQSLENSPRVPRSKFFGRHNLRNIIHVEHKRILNVYKLRIEV